jgi:uncharacterized membrane protein (Fun14 family)
MNNEALKQLNAYQYDSIDWRAAIWAGVIAGIVFMMVEMLMVMFFQGQGPWGPPRMIAAMVLGKDVLPPPADFDIAIMMTAMMIHFPLSIVYGLIVGLAVRRFSNILALIIGGVFGLIIYFINFYLIAPIMFPWFTEAQNWISLVSHLIYGLMLGGTFAGLRHYKSNAENK